MALAKHIEVAKSNGRVTVTVDDLEVFDFVEDDLIETYNIEYDYTSELKVGGCPCFIMHFAVGESFDRIERAIQAIPEAEVERILILNRER